VRGAAVSSLGKLRDPKAAEPLIKLLEDRDPDVREAAVNALGLIGSELAIEPLVLTLVDPQSSIRQAAAYALRRTEPYWERSEAAARAIPRLQAALKSHEYWVRHSAADALKKLGVSQEREGSLATDSDGALRKRQAAQAVLISMLSDSDREFRQAAAEALGRIGLADSIPALAQRLADGDRGVQAAAARSLEGLRWQAPNPREKARQWVALERWAELVPLGADAVEALTAALAWNDPILRRRAIETLVQIGGPRGISALRALAADPSGAVREDAERALAVFREARPEGRNGIGAECEAKDAWGTTTLIS
jgi:HEAT repeat protein